MDQRHAQLKAEALGEVVAEQDLRDRAVEALVGGVADFAAVLLECGEMGELFGETEPPAGRAAVQVVDIIYGAEVARGRGGCGERESGDENGFREVHGKWM